MVHKLQKLSRYINGKPIGIFIATTQNSFSMVHKLQKLSRYINGKPIGIRLAFQAKKLVNENKHIKILNSLDYKKNIVRDKVSKVIKWIKTKKNGMIEYPVVGSSMTQ